MNFKRLKKLINECEREGTHANFFERLYSISKEELNLKQSSLGEFL